MVSPSSTILTERQVEVLELRREGHTQQEVAEKLGTTDANVSAIERAGKENIEKARRTLELIQTISSPVRIQIEQGTSFEAMVDHIYAKADETGTKLAYCRPELHSHLFGMLQDQAEQNDIVRAVEVGITREGDVKVFVDED